MKNSLLLFTFVAAAFSLSLVSCNSGSSVKSLSSDADSLAYAQGVRISEGFRFNAVQRLGVDSTLVPKMIEGLKDAFYYADDAERAYFIGAQYGVALRDQVLKNIEARMEDDGDSTGINEDVFFAAFADAVNEKELLIDNMTAETYIRKAELVRHLQYVDQKYADNKITSKEFLDHNATQPGIVVLPSGLQYKVEKMGNGPKPQDKERVRVNYKGTLVDGTVFDSSYERKEPAVFGLNNVIKGFSEGLKQMPVGSKFTLFIPDSLGYGDRELEKIKPFSALIFEVELLGIE